MSYWKWNDALGDYFFRQSRPGQRILLYLDRKLIDKIGAERGIGGWEEFCEGLRQGPIKVSFPSYLPDLVESWQGVESPNPPHFLCGIAVLVLAWTERRDQDFGYYAALDDFCSRFLAADLFPRDLVRKLVNHFETIRIWSQQWPEFPGTFADEPLQDYKYVGRIRHHALVSPLERDNLHFIWRSQAITPGSKPSIAWLIHLTEQEPKVDQMIPQLLGMLSHRKQQARDSVRDWMAEEFRNWAGTAPEEPHNLAANWEDQFQLRIVLAPRQGWGLRLYHPSWKGEFRAEWKGKTIVGTIGTGGWSERFRIGDELLKLDYTSSMRPVRISLVQPTPLELKHFPSPFFHPAGALGAFGADYIDSPRPLKETPFFHWFPKKELAEWKEWKEEKSVENWREREIEVDLPPHCYLFFGDEIRPPQRENQSAPRSDRDASQAPNPVFPIRAQGFEAAWTYSPDGGLHKSDPIQISHYWMTGVDHSCAPNSKWSVPISLTGSAEPVPGHVDFWVPLLRKGRTEISFSEFYACLEDWSEKIDVPLEKKEARILRRQMASLGYFLENPQAQRLQLAPPSFVLFPDNRHRVRAMLAGVWTAPLLDTVETHCREGENGLQLEWIEQESPFLPPTGRLSFLQLRHLEQLQAVLEESFPGVVGRWQPCSYAQTLLESLEIPATRGWFPDEEGMRVQSRSPLDFMLSPQRYTFQLPNPIPHFPILSRTYNERLGYPMFTWWDNEAEGFHCNGEWAVWRLLRRHRAPALFVDADHPDRIFLPAFLPLPALVERALTMASGKIGPLVDAEISPGRTIVLRSYEDIRFPLRRALVKLLFGLSVHLETDIFFHPISFQSNFNSLKNGSVDQ